VDSAKRGSPRWRHHLRMSSLSHETVDALAKEQDGVVSRRQLAELGITRHQIRDAVRGRRWRLVGHAVVVHRGPLEGPAR
jgi:hypothetical protein